jgi:Holliday junction resolvasome RuvABC endonuclease subunit
MNVLALDLGTCTGWATNVHGRDESGVQTFDVKRGESPGMRYVRFNAWLGQWAPDGWRPDLIVYEQTHNRGGAATEVAAGFATRVQEFCARHGIEHSAVHSATLKKFATGRGNAKKPEMIEAARVRFGYQGEDDDEADALALLHFARVELVPA